jgi:hypothetical protein
VHAIALGVAAVLFDFFAVDGFIAILAKIFPRLFPLRDIE